MHSDIQKLSKMVVINALGTGSKDPFWNMSSEGLISLIAKYVLAYTPHMHLIQSGTQYLTGASNRISREAFKDITIAMQQFQKDKYPELVNSLVDHQKNKSSKNIDRANSKINSPERTKDKDVLLGLLETTYAKSTSVEHFLSQVKEHGHEPYFRNGRLQGIKFEGERKFRLTNLGFKEKLEELANRKESHAKSLYEIRNIRSRGKTIENTKNVHVIEKDNIDGVHLDLEQQAIQELSTMRENRSEQIQKEPIEDDIKNIPDDEAEDVDSTRYFASESDDESEV